MSKPRIFYFAATPPNRQNGATLAMYRHFIEHDDFELFVATSGLFEREDVPSLRLTTPAWLSRISRTRFWRTVRNGEILLRAGHLPEEVVRAAENFRPEAVFTVADLMLAEAARKLARHLKVPLIVNFQDWWPRGQFYYAQERPYAWVVPILEKRFHALYQAADLAFCTSEGMREFLGPHRNSHVLYPLNAAGRADGGGTDRATNGKARHRIVYAGTLFASYGRQIRRLLEAAEEHPALEFRIYGGKPDWPEAEIEKWRALGVYRGFLPFEDLARELREADGFLTVLSFEPELETMMRTSFTTKFLDYSAFGKPILVWGPAYSGPLRLAENTGAAVAVSQAEPEILLAQAEEIYRTTGRAEELGRRALELSRTVFSHEGIHGLLVREIRKAVRTEE